MRSGRINFPPNSSLSDFAYCYKYRASKLEFSWLGLPEVVHFTHCYELAILFYRKIAYSSEQDVLSNLSHSVFLWFSQSWVVGLFYSSVPGCSLKLPLLNWVLSNDRFCKMIQCPESWTNVFSKDIPSVWPLLVLLVLARQSGIHKFCP